MTPGIAPDNPSEDFASRTPENRAAAWREPLACLSLANLWYLAAWSELTTYTRGDMFLMSSTTAPSTTKLLAVSANVLLLAALFYGAVVAARQDRSGKALRIVHLFFAVSLAVPLNAIRNIAGNRYLPYLKGELLRIVPLHVVVIAAALLAVAAIVVAVRSGDVLAKAGMAAPLILSPFLLITLLSAAGTAYKLDTAVLRDGPTAPLVASPAQPPNRFVWLLFDEMDYRLAFLDRRDGLTMPEFDRFSSEAFHATAAYPPHRDTIESVPSLLTGASIEKIAQLGPSELMITVAGNRAPVSFKDYPNIFSESRRLGVNSAVVGWFLPYGRILSNSVAACWWWPFDQQAGSIRGSFFGAMSDETRRLFETSLFSPFGQSLVTRQHAEAYREMLDRVAAVATDPRFSLVFAHLPIPHGPNIYDRRTGGLTMRNNPINGYVDNLALADRTFGRIRRALEAAGEWNGASVLVTSDHGYRTSRELDGKADPRVPFLLKLAGQTEGVVYEKRFGTRITHDLVLATLSGEIRDTAGLAAWMSIHVDGHYMPPAEFLRRNTVR